MKVSSFDWCYIKYWQNVQTTQKTNSKLKASAFINNTLCFPLINAQLVSYRHLMLNYHQSNPTHYRNSFHSQITVPWKFSPMQSNDNIHRLRDLDKSKQFTLCFTKHYPLKGRNKKEKGQNLTCNGCWKSFYTAQNKTLTFLLAIAPFYICI
jgi:hypothetical protein